MTDTGYMHANSTFPEPARGPDTPSGASSFNGNRIDYLSPLILATRKSVKLEKETLLRILAERDTPDQVIKDLVELFTGVGSEF